jgi:hypothetical protein
VGTSPPLHLPLSFLAHQYPTMSPMLSSASTHLAVVGSASTSVNRTVVPPCTAAAGFPRSLGHATSTIEFARGWRSPWSSWPGRRPHRRRAVAAGVSLPLPMTDPWGRGPTCLSPLARVCTLHRVHLAFQRLMFKRNLKMISRKDVNALEIHNLLILGSKIVKQILVDFLIPDIRCKNIACQV